MEIREVNRSITAIHRKSLSAPYKNLIKHGRLFGRVLDYGCGHGYDVIECRKRGMDIHGFDKFQQEWNSPPTGTYDVVTCNYVLNVIECPAERKELVEYIKSLTDCAYFTVRSDFKSIKSSWEPMNDGYYTTNKTFQKFYTVESLLAEFGDVEIIESNNTRIMFKTRRN